MAWWDCPWDFWRTESAAKNFWPRELLFGPYLLPARAGSIVILFFSSRGWALAWVKLRPLPRPQAGLATFFRQSAGQSPWRFLCWACRLAERLASFLPDPSR